MDYSRLLKKSKSINRLLKLTRNHLIDLFDFQNNINSNEELFNNQIGQRCFILGTGVSLNNIKLDLLSNEHVFGSNHIFLHPIFCKIESTYYFEISQLRHLLYLDSNSILFYEMITSSKDIDYFSNTKEFIKPSCMAPLTYYKRIDSNINGNCKMFLRSSSENYINKHNLFSQKKKYYLKGSFSMLETDRQEMNLSRRITFLDGSIFTMITTAIFMGFKEIYLIGADYALSPTLQGHFYENVKFPKKIGEAIAKDLIYQFATVRDVEIYRIEEDKDYFLPIFIQRHNDYQRHIIANNIAHENGVVIKLVTPNGFQSPVYDQISWENVLESILKKDLKILK